MSGGGHIIIDSAIQQALADPLVHGALPPKHKAAIDLFIHTDPGMWTDEQHVEAFKAFEWAHKHL